MTFNQFSIYSNLSEVLWSPLINFKLLSSSKTSGFAFTVATHTQSSSCLHVILLLLFVGFLINSGHSSWWHKFKSLSAFASYSQMSSDCFFLCVHLSPPMNGKTLQNKKRNLLQHFLINRFLDLLWDSYKAPVCVGKLWRRRRRLLHGLRKEEIGSGREKKTKSRKWRSIPFRSHLERPGTFLKCQLFLALEV